MSFPSGTTLNTTNLDSSTDDPSLARADLLATVNALNAIISSENSNNGVVVADASGKISVSQLPTSFGVTGSLTLNPTSGVVNIQDVIRLTTLTATEILNLSGSQTGDIAFSIDGASGGPSLCFFDGTDWRQMSIAGLTLL
jgi:hypothetical protein